jgi:hypothetical protein
MRYRVMTLALVGLIPLAGSHAADAKLVKAVSDHFELYTTDNDAAAKAALTHFETVRGFLLKALHAADPFTTPVRIFGFKSSGDYTSYLPQNGDSSSNAFSWMSGDRPVILMSSMKKESYQFGVREYVTLLFGRLDPKMPYWLKVGFGEFYSTLQPDNGMVAMGVQPYRDFRSTVSTDFNMEVMFALNGGISRNKGAADFYAEPSAKGIPQAAKGAEMANLEATTTVDYPVILWQLTHMLMFKKEYSAKFGAFVAALQDEKTVSALGQVYGQSLAGLKQDLIHYIALPSHELRYIKFQLDNPVTTKVSQFNAADSAAALAELKAAK